MALRGGTSLNKLFFNSYARFSEDIDLVQITPGDNGIFIEAIRDKLDPILGDKPKRKIGTGITTLIYSFISTDGFPIKLKIETNTREHAPIFALCKKEFTVQSPWFQGQAHIQTYSLEELLGTKLRALYQRKKGRDLYDLWAIAKECPIEYKKIIDAFNYYISFQNLKITKKEVEKNVELKILDQTFRDDISSLLRTGVDYDIDIAHQWFGKNILAAMA